MPNFSTLKAPATGTAITRKNGRLVVPDDPIIPYIEGDGTGPDIWRASVRVFDAAVEKAYAGKRKIAWVEVLAGEKSFKKLNTWLPDETVTAFQEFLVGIKGPLTTPVGGGIRSLNVALRQMLDLIRDADSVELKLTIAETARATTVAALGVDTLDAQMRQVYFFDTPDLALNQAGVVVRARRRQGEEGDTVVKLRPVVPGDLPEELRRSRGFNVEVDAMPGGHVCSASFKGSADNVVLFFNAVAEEVRRYLASIGARSLNEVIGRTDYLEQRTIPDHPKANLIDLSRLLAHRVRAHGVVAVQARAVRQREEVVVQRADHLLRVELPVRQRAARVRAHGVDRPQYADALGLEHIFAAIWAVS